MAPIILNLPLSDYGTYEYNIQPYNTKNMNINDLRTKHLNAEEKEKLLYLCKKYSNIFKHPDDKLSFSNSIKHEIKTKDEIPVRTKNYRYPFIHKEEVT